MRAWKAESGGAASRRVLGLALASVLLVSACASKQEIVYVDHHEDREESASATTPLTRSASPLVHPDGNHHPADAVQIGPGHADSHEQTYTPIAAQGSHLVGGGHHPAAPVSFAHERDSGAASYATHPVPTTTTVARAGTGTGAGTVAKPGAAAPTGAAARSADSPAVPDRLTLGPGLGASASPATRTPGNTLALTDDAGEDKPVTIAGRIESVVGQMLTVKTAAGSTHVRLGERSRVDRDALGTQDDLKPGRFVGVVQIPGGPAASVRLYATGPSMPNPGIVPVIGSRSGQVTSFGSVVTLQFGGVLLNTGGATTTVTLPSGVEILKPAPADPSALTVGTQIIATGTMSEDDVLTASAVRITGEARPAR